MGYDTWKGSTHDARQQAWQTAGYSSAFTHDEDIRAGRKAAGIDPLNDPRRKAGSQSKYAGRVVREVCICDEHPNPTAIAVVFDVTASMGELPRIVQKGLPRLQGRLTDQGYADDPQLLFGAVGDARTDRFPLQMGQFESDNRGDAQLEALFIEGGGGGQGSETYELAALYLAAAAVLEPFDQFGKKGYLFTVGDERPAGVVQRDYNGHTWKSLTGLPLEDDVDARTVVHLVTQRFNWFHFVVDSTKFGGMYRIGHALPAWQALLGDRAQPLGEAEALPDAIAAIVGVMEGKIDRATAEKDVGKALVLTV